MPLLFGKNHFKQRVIQTFEGKKTKPLERLMAKGSWAAEIWRTTNGYSADSGISGWLRQLPKICAHWLLAQLGDGSPIAFGLLLLMSYCRLLYQPKCLSVLLILQELDTILGLLLFVFVDVCMY